MAGAQRAFAATRAAESARLSESVRINCVSHDGVTTYALISNSFRLDGGLVRQFNEGAPPAPKRHARGIGIALHSN